MPRSAPVVNQIRIVSKPPSIEDPVVVDGRSLLVSMLEQPRLFVIPLYWFHVAVANFYVHPTTQWADVIKLFEAIDFWDCHGQVRLRVDDPRVKTVYVDPPGKKILDWKNRQRRHRQRSISDVGLKRGVVLRVELVGGLHPALIEI